ncbi:MAG: InlB B-repeat-containing protein, partial [Clostridia bacterium]|nr:InlB B-repeat-containing protein [Clostridia bacterium]
ETSLAIEDPTFSGFRFMGWYLDPDFTVPAGDVIAADVAADTTLYAKWLQVMDVVDLTVIVDHTQKGDDGLANNYNKTLYAQLTHDSRLNDGNPNREFVAIEGFERAYPNGMWHTRGDDVKEDIFQVPAFYTHLSSEYDYQVNVALEGYYVTEKTVEKIAQPDGSTLHKVTVKLKYDPDLLDLNFYVRLDSSVYGDQTPASAQVKITCWGDDTDAEIDWKWATISQHKNSSVSVTIDPETGIGYGTYPVWQWYDKARQIPYHYRVDVVQLTFADGTSIPLNATIENVTSNGQGFTSDIETAGGSLPNFDDANNSTNLDGVFGAQQGDGYVQQGTIGAVISLNRVVFHANNASYMGNDVFRTYYYDGMPMTGENEFPLDANGAVPSFYDIPEIEYATHNEFIFKGWYMDPVSEDKPFDWNQTNTGDVHVYAHWIATGTVEKEDDGKQYGGTYAGYDLLGVQIRDAEKDHLHHHGSEGSGLRFITVLSERVYAEINAIERNEDGAEYGFVMAKTSTLLKYAGDTEGYTLQYNDFDVNGVDTTTDYKYVQNMACNGVVDHYKGETYFLYTAVITYKGLEGDALAQAYDTDFTARSYIRYWDANGLFRTYYNNYTGNSNTANGCTTSFSTVRGMM